MSVPLVLAIAAIAVAAGLGVVVAVLRAPTTPQSDVLPAFEELACPGQVIAVLAMKGVYSRGERVQPQILLYNSGPSTAEVGVSSPTVNVFALSGGLKLVHGSTTFHDPPSEYRIAPGGIAGPFDSSGWVVDEGPGLYVFSWKDSPSLCAHQLFVVSPAQ